MNGNNSLPPGWGENPENHLPCGFPPEQRTAVPPAPPAAAPVPQQPEPYELSTSPQPVKAAPQRTSEPAEAPYVPPVQPAPSQPKSNPARTIGLVIGLFVLLGGASFFIGYKLANRGTGSAEASSADSAMPEGTEAENITSESEKTTALTEQNMVTDTQPSTAAAETATALESSTGTKASAAASTENSVFMEINTAAATIATVQTTKATTTAKTTTTTKATTAAPKAGSVHYYPKEELEKYPEYSNSLIDMFSDDNTFCDIPNILLAPNEVYYRMIDLNADQIPEFVLFDKNSTILIIETTVKGECVKLIDNTDTYGGAWFGSAHLTDKGYVTFSSGGGGGSAISFCHYMKGKDIKEDGTVIWRDDAVVFQSADGKERTITDQDAQSIINSFGQDVTLY